MPPTPESQLQGILSRIAAVVPLNPKQTPSKDALWFGYYAGYADAFVQHILAALREGTPTVLDPWNGAGTTTAMAAQLGLPAIGLDVNPAAVIVAKARLLRSDVANSIQPLAQDILRHAHNSHANLTDDDLLARWLMPSGATLVRRIERAIHRVLVSPRQETEFSPPDTAKLSSLAALFYLALFRVVRKLMQPFFSSNPTWIRLKVNPSERLELTGPSLTDLFRREIEELYWSVTKNNYPAQVAPPQALKGDSTEMPISGETIDAIVTSPPYCTRIDYAIATLPQLATLGLNWREVTALRAELIGTPTILRDSSRELAADSPRLCGLLEKVERHTSYASTSYYLPFYEQYFSRMRSSLVELYRVARPGAPLALVVQDSWFKDIRVNTPAILTEIAVSQGWNLASEHSFKVKTRATMHPGRVRRVRKTPLRATETVTLLVR
jgi:hypothetical protein